MSKYVKFNHTFKVLMILLSVFALVPALASADAISIGNATVTEIDGAGITATFTVSVDGGGPASSTINFDVDTISGSATGGSDYVNIINGPGSIASGTFFTNIVVTINGDTVVEADETFAVRISNPSGGHTITVDTGTGTIQNDDAATLALSAPAITETDADFTATFTATLTGGVQGGFDVAVSAADGSAVSPADYELATTSVSFAGGTGETQNVSVTIKGDDIVEADETFSVTLGAVSNADAVVVGAITTGASDTGTITNDDTATLTIGDKTFTETDTDQTVIFTITADAAVEGGFDVAVSASDGGATDPADYELVTTGVTFAGNAGELQTVSLTIKGDTIVEDNETFTVTLGDVTNTTAVQDAAITTGDTAQGTINNDDAATLTIVPLAVSQNETVSPYQFRVTLDNAVEGGFDVAYTSDSGSATAGADFVDNDSALTFAGNAGEFHDIDIVIISDGIVEGTENFGVTLRDVTNTTAVQDASITTGASAIGTITDTGTATLSISAAPSQNEGTSPYIFTVTLDLEVEDGFDVDYTSDSGSATVGSDFTDNDGTLSFAGNAGESHQIQVVILEDGTVEDSETFAVTLGTVTPVEADPADITTGAIGTGTIADNDTATFTIDDISAYEGDTATFTISLDTPIDKTVDIDVNYGGGTATGGTDYDNATDTVTFGAGSTPSRTVTVTHTDDYPTSEVPAETYTATLAVNAGTPIGGRDVVLDTGTGTILDEPRADFSPSPISGNEPLTVTFTDISTSYNNAFSAWEWDFDSDGSVDSTDQNPTYDYLQEGVYTVTLTVTDNGGRQDSETKTGIITVFDSVSTAAFSFSYAPLSGLEPVTAEFTDLTNPYDPATFSWDLDGDGLEDSNTASVKGYVYAQAGTYTITLTVTEADGHSSSATDSITILDTAPQAEFNLDLPNGPEPHTVTFTNLSSGYDTPLTYSWDFDYNAGTAGEPSADSTDKDPVHTYPQDGTFNVLLTVTDADGSTDTYSGFVTVTDETPVADFGASPVTGPVPLTVNFTDQSSISGNDPVTYPTNDTLVAWGWSFGDGDVSTDQNPTHEYTAVGTYTVTLTVEDSDGSLATASSTITVTPNVSDPDNDSDGWTVLEGDCNDNNAAVNPGAAEICGDSIDQDCFDGDLVCPLQGECIVLADKPLDTQLQGDPPNIMLVIDDSGSMDWEMLVDTDLAIANGENTNNGAFWIGGDDYYYLFNNNDNLYSTWSYPPLTGATDMRRYLARFYRYNVMYYNPNYEYIPWFGESNANLNAPRAHPMDNSITVDLNDTLYSVNANSAGSGGGGTIIDITLDEEVAVTVSGTWNYDGGTPGGYNGDDKWTSGNTTSTIRYTWTPTVSGNYDISMYTTSTYSLDTNARYDYSHGASNGTTHANQDTGGWKTLWTAVSLTAGTPIQVFVSRVQNQSTNTYTDADAIRFVTSGGGGGSTFTADITDAHYHTWVDADSDGVVDAGEDQYLVNFADSDSNNAFDQREFYLFDDADNDQIVDDGELTLVDIANVPAGLKTRSYADDLQNFANWFSFYRKRWLTTIAALTQVLPEFQGVNLGYRTINGDGVQPVLPMKVPGKADSTTTLLNALKNFRQNPRGTPLREGLEMVGLYFHTTETSSDLEASLETSPLSTDTGGACQQNFALIFTDGAWNGSYSNAAGNADDNEGQPYEDNYSNTLADVAHYFYENDLAPAIANEVPTNFYDKATWQHMVTYGVSFGVRGTLTPSDYDLYNLNPALRVYPTWPDPITWSSDRGLKRIDDVYHAAVNGRGQYLSASNPGELVNKVKEVVRDVISRIGSGAAVTINGEELDTGSVVYQSIYSTDGWTGDVKAFPINLTTGEVQRDTPVWSAEEQLAAQNWNTGRIIATFNGTTGIPFRFAAANDALFNLIDVDDAKATEMIEYLRGDDSNEVRNGGGYRNRTVTLADGITVRSSKLGDIVHSSPVFQRYLHGGTYHDTIYAGGNDGMLHAIDASNGQEQFAYVPRHVVANLKDLTQVGYDHRYYVDLSPYIGSLTIPVATAGVGDGVDNDGVDGVDQVGEIEPRTFLVGGLGKGGRGYYALDVTDPKDITSETALASAVKWEFPANDLYISAATNATPIVVTTTTNHGFTAGDFVAIEGVEGNLAANGVWKIDNVTATSFSLHLDDGSNSTGNGVYTSGTGRVTPDQHMGYSFSRAFLVNSKIGYVVIFGNGYNSPARNAVLYVLDAATGTLLKKIDTQHGVYGDGTSANGNCNGLSTPQLIDVDADAVVDYAYVGDLNGNMWKFDLTGNSINDWDVAYKTGGGMPKPVFQAKDASGNEQPITGMPDVMLPCDPNSPGYFVVFGTGKYLGQTDFSNRLTQTLYGIWDYGDDIDDDEYIGSFERGSATQLSNLTSNASLLKQEVLTDVVVSGNVLRILTDNTIVYNLVADTDSIGTGADPSNDTTTPTLTNMGWYFDLPERKERAVRDVILRSNKAIIISSLPNTSPCSAGGESYLHEMDACTGGRVTQAQLDINADGVIDDKDLVKIKKPGLVGDPDPDDPDDWIFVAPTAIWYPTMVYTPTILDVGETELKLMSTAAGGIINLIEQGEEKGLFYWRLIEN